jgi:hypothetical protein
VIGTLFWVLGRRTRQQSADPAAVTAAPPEQP